MLTTMMAKVHRTPTTIGEEKKNLSICQLGLAHIYAYIICYLAVCVCIMEVCMRTASSPASVTFVKRSFRKDQIQNESLIKWDERVQMLIIYVKPFAAIKFV